MRRETDGNAHLRLADSVSEQAEREPIAAVARRAGMSLPVAEKLRWLARAYRPADRKAIGVGVLSELSPSHLEVAAQAGAARVALLRRAAEERMPVRQLRLLVEQATRVTGPVAVTGGASDLASAGSSLARYAALPDPALDRLLTGPNGHLIRQLAAAGRQLAARLDTAGAH